MDGVLGIFQSISNANSSDLNIYIKALNEHQSFRFNISGPTDPAIQHVTALISRPTTRYEGLLLLQSLLKQCSLDVIEQKGVLWVTLCTKACNQKDGDSIISLAYDALIILLQKSIELPELSKSFSSNQIGKICETFLNVSPTGQLSALKCLEFCLKMYPGPCGGNSKTIIQRYISNFIDSTDEQLVIWSGKCMHLLQQVRGGGIQGSSHKTAWQNYQNNLLGSLHRILDSLYANCPEIYDDNIENGHLNINSLDLSNEPLQRASQLCTRFKNLLFFLIIAIREPFPVSKSFMPKKILNLICRGLGVNCTMLQNNPISDNIAIGALLPDLHIHLFRLAETLITTLKSHISMYYEIILNFSCKTLKWTSTGKSDGFRRPYGGLRAAAYNMLSLWCKTMKYASCCEFIYENIVDQIINDITPFQNEMTLKVLSGAKKYMSKKARRQLHKTQNEKSHLAQTYSKSFDPNNTKVVYSDQDNESICVAALNCLNSAILSSACFLKPILIKELQEKIILICLQCNELCSITDKSKLYSNYLCRQSVYNVLTSIVLSPHHLCPPPTQLTIHLLSVAQTSDSNPIVRDTCGINLKTLEKLLHPQKESLYFPPDLIQIKNAVKVCSLNSKELSDDEENSLHSSDDDNVSLRKKNDPFNHYGNYEKINIALEPQKVQHVGQYNAAHAEQYNAEQHNEEHVLEQQNVHVGNSKSDTIQILDIRNIYETDNKSSKRKLQNNADNDNSYVKINVLDNQIKKSRPDEATEIPAHEEAIMEESNRNKSNISSVHGEIVIMECNGNKNNISNKHEEITIMEESNGNKEITTDNHVTVILDELDDDHVNEMADIFVNELQANI